MMDSPLHRLPKFDMPMAYGVNDPVQTAQTKSGSKGLLTKTKNSASSDLWSTFEVYFTKVVSLAKAIRTMMTVLMKKVRCCKLW
jgi:hypothetical protein